VSLFASIILSLVEGEFIGAAEMGQLAQVCKLLAKETRKNDDIWAALCTLKFPCTHSFTTAFKEQTSYYSLYKLWSAPIVKRQRTEAPLDPPACSESDLHLFFNVKYDGKSIYSNGFNGEDALKHLCKSGGIGNHLNQPIVLGKAEWAFSEEERALYEALGNDATHGLPVRCTSFDMNKVEMYIHVFRNTDRKMLCICRSKEREYESYLPKVHPRVEDADSTPTPTSQAPFDFQRGQTGGKLMYANVVSQEQLPFKESRASLQILRRLPYIIHFGCGLHLFWHC
jgi:hypothetical protein